MKRRYFGRIGKCQICGGELKLKKRFFGLLLFRSCSGCGSSTRY